MREEAASVTVSFGITYVDTWNDCLKSSRRGVERIYLSGQIFAAACRAILTSRGTRARAMTETFLFEKSCSRCVLRYGLRAAPDGRTDERPVSIVSIVCL
jgi:hypothetical protein